MFEEAGLPHAERLDLVPNSRRALVLSELARDRGVMASLHPRLFDAYWARGLDIGSEAVLLEEGRAAGLSEEEMAGAFEDPSYTERVQAATEEAIELGVSGVPAWVIDQRVLVPGAQPHEVFAQVMERLGYRSAGP
jgi:predicted DsbA family dithiol-disulfide isomerase